MKLKTKKITKFFSRIRSRHPSHDVFRKFFKFSVRSVIRFGSTTVEDVDYELNSIEAVKNSSNKLKMKELFVDNNIPTADWWTTTDGELFTSYNQNINRCATNSLPYPIVAKGIFGSRNSSNTLIQNEDELRRFLQGKTLSNYIFEKFCDFVKEYRIHVSKNGMFYTCRKMLKSDTPDDQRWFRNNLNSVWYLPENEHFDKPDNWDTEIIPACIDALNAVGLDFAAIDLKVQKNTKRNGSRREQIKFVILETNSAPSMGEITEIKYKENIPLIFKNKYGIN